VLTEIQKLAVRFTDSHGGDSIVPCIVSDFSWFVSSIHAGCIN
jgi:hypothetical protein